MTLKVLFNAIKYKKDVSIPRAAVRALGELNDPNAVEALIDFFIAGDDQGDSYLQILTLEAFGHLANPRGINPLLRSLENNDPEMRYTAAQALEEMAQKGIREDRVIEPLIARLHDTQPRVRNMAAAALRQNGWQPGKDHSAILYHISWNEWDQLIDIGEPAIDPLARVIETDKTKYSAGFKTPKQQAIRILGEIGGVRATDMLFDLLKSNLDERSHTEQALNQSAKKEIEPFISRLSDSSISDEMSRVIIGSIEHNGSQQARDVLANALNHPKPYVQQWATYALASLRDRRAIPVLEHILETGPAYEQGRAINALAWFGDEQMIPLFVRILSRAYETGYSGPTEKAAHALEKLGWKPDTIERSVFYYLTLNQLDKCLEIGEPAITPLIALLWEHTSNSAEVLEKMGPVVVEPLCIALKKDAKDPSTSYSPTKSPPGNSYLESEPWNYKGAKFREAVIKILVKIGDPRAVETLTLVSQIDHCVIDLLENSDIPAKDLHWPIREAAKAALKEFANKQL